MSPILASSNNLTSIQSDRAIRRSPLWNSNKVVGLVLTDGILVTNLFCPLDRWIEVCRIDLRQRHEAGRIRAAIPVLIEGKMVRPEVHYQERLRLKEPITSDEERREGMGSAQAIGVVETLDQAACCHHTRTAAQGKPIQVRYGLLF
jgi:hypothetical protein